MFCIDPFWGRSSFVASIEDAKPVLILIGVLYQGRFCNLTQHKAGLGAGTKPVLERLV